VTDFQQNPCGGARWRTLSRGFVEIEGAGTPLIDPNSSTFANLARTWANFGPEISSAAGAYGLPTAWLLAFATQESGFLSADREKQRLATSPAGARGFLQILPGNGGPYPGISADTYYDPDSCAQLSAKFIRDKLVVRYGFELPLLGAGYNAGSVRCAPGLNIFNLFEEGNYSHNLVKFTNSALTYLDLAPPFSMATALAWSTAGATLLAAAWYANDTYGWVDVSRLRRFGLA
jgi:hypothetical protein